MVSTSPTDVGFPGCFGAGEVLLATLAASLAAMISAMVAIGVKCWEVVPSLRAVSSGFPLADVRDFLRPMSEKLVCCFFLFFFLEESKQSADCFQCLGKTFVVRFWFRVLIVLR